MMVKSDRCDTLSSHLPPSNTEEMYFKLKFFDLLVEDDANFMPGLDGQAAEVNDESDPIKTDFSDEADRWARATAPAGASTPK